LVGYVDNFLDFPAGVVVPVGAYDRELNRWVPHESGVVMDVLGVGPGGASVDITGDGVAESATVLLARGITSDELLLLATLRAPGDSVWRIRVPHFTEPYDCNWPIGPPGDAAGPPPPPAGAGGPGGGGSGSSSGSGNDGDDDDDDAAGPELDDPCKKDGSIIECQNLVLRERVALAGTGYSLNYASDRMPLRPDRLDFHVPISGATVPASLKRIDLTISVMGRRFLQSFPPLPNQRFHFQWDGVDAYGRKPQGLVPATVTTSFVYDGVYRAAARFADYGGVQLTGDRARGELFFSNTWESPALGSLDSTAGQLGGWTLSAHHVYDARAKVVYLGDGSTRRMAAQGALITSGFGRTETSADPLLGDVGPDGRVYFSDGRRV
jgi:hypothetical protein